MIYLDNAATTGKKPLSVIKAVTSALENLSANPGRGGHRLSMSASQAVYNARKKAAEFFGAKSEENVIFTPGCTYSLNFALKGVLSPGDRIITSSVEHNSVMRPLESLKKIGVKVDVAEVIFSDMSATVRSFERLITDKTKAIVCTHASNVTGEILPIAQIGELCRQRGIIFIVDAAQTAGIVPIDCNEMNIDFLCVAPHKGLYAPMGIGILIANKPIFNTLIEGGSGVLSALPTPPPDYPERIESGTVNLPGIVGTAAGIDFVLSKGMANIYRFELELIQTAYKGLEKINGIVFYTPYPEIFSFTPVLTFNIRNKPSSWVSDKLNNYSVATRSGLHCAPSIHKRMGTMINGTVRISTSAFNTKSEIYEFIKIINNISGQKQNF